MYYYIYYILALFAKKYNNRSNDFAFTAILYYFLLGALGIVFVSYFILGKNLFNEKSQLVIFISCVIPAAIHYFALIQNKRYLDIIKKYDSVFVFNTKAKLVSVLLVLYLLVAITSAFYIGSLAREGK